MLPSKPFRPWIPGADGRFGPRPMQRRGWMEAPGFQRRDFKDALWRGLAADAVGLAGARAAVAALLGEGQAVELRPQHGLGLARFAS